MESFGQEENVGFDEDGFYAQGNNQFEKENTFEDIPT